jgi:predicted DNA-binding protein
MGGKEERQALPREESILQLVKSLLLEVDDELADRLERIAPTRSRRWSEFVRGAILKAVWEAEEQVTAEAYARHPDSPDAAFDPAVWEGRGVRPPSA